MKFSVLSLLATSALLPFVAAGLVLYPPQGQNPPTDYGGGSGGSGGGSGGSVGYGDSGSGDGYGSGGQKCTPYFETVNEQKCESYNDEICRTTQQESCESIQEQRCQAQVSSQVVNKCVNVTETRCSIVEDVKFEVIQLEVTVQKCDTVQESVCDMTYESSVETKNQQQCITLENPRCDNEQRTIYDHVCVTETTFDCVTTGGGQGGGQGGYGNNGNNGYGQQSTDVSGYGQDNSGGYGSGGSGGSGYEQTQCSKKTETKCSKTPRVVNMVSCQQEMENVCETSIQRIPMPKENQQCRQVDTKRCSLEPRTTPKQVKKYTYQRQCRNIPRSICAEGEIKSLAPQCYPATRRQCSYAPVKECQKVPKKHCYNVQRRVQKERCEPVYGKPSGGANPSYPTGSNPSYPTGSNPGSYPSPNVPSYGV